MPLSSEARDALQRELVAVVRGDDARLFTHHDFLAAQQDATLRRLDELVPAGATARAGMRALVRLKTDEEHRRVLSSAVCYLFEFVPAVEPSPDTRGRVVAVFPGTAWT